MRKYLFSLAGCLHMNNKLLHESVEELTGKKSLNDLTEKEERQVIRALESALRYEYTIEPGQKRKILQLGFSLGWNCKQIKGFIKYLIGKKDYNILQRGEASKVIEGLKGILKRKRNAQ